MRIRPKTDSKTQQQLQCALRFDDVFKHLVPGGNREVQEQAALWGLAFPATLASKARELTR